MPFILFSQKTQNKSKTLFSTPNKIVPIFKSFNEQSKENCIDNLNKNHLNQQSFENIDEKTKIINDSNTNFSVNSQLQSQIPIIILVETLNFPKIINYLSVHSNTRKSALLLQAIRQVYFNLKKFLIKIFI